MEKQMATSVPDREKTSKNREWQMWLRGVRDPVAVVAERFVRNGDSYEFIADGGIVGVVMAADLQCFGLVRYATCPDKDVTFEVVSK